MSVLVPEAACQAVGSGPLSLVANIQLDTDTISAAAGVASAVIAIGGAVIAGRGARDAREAAKKARAPLLTTNKPPQIVDAAPGGIEVRFTARNEGTGTARIVSYAVCNALGAPAQESRVTKLENAKDRSLAALMVAPMNYGKFAVTVGPKSVWFHDTIRDRREWVLEIVYTDVAASECACTRFSVVPDGTSGWSLTEQRTETRTL